MRRSLPFPEDTPEVKVAVNKCPLHTVVPKEGYSYGNKHLRHDKHVVRIISRQSLHPAHPCDPLGQCKSTPSVEHDAHSPDKQVFHSHVDFLTSVGMKHPAIIDDAVRDTSHHRADESGIQVEKASPSTYYPSGYNQQDKTIDARKDVVHHHSPPSWQLLHPADAQRLEDIKKAEEHKGSQAIPHVPGRSGKGLRPTQAPDSPSPKRRL